jgi:hypothetical protein
MKLPNADKALVEQEKILGYLLNSQHRYGSSKAKFFGKFGFTAQSWQVLADALLGHGRQHEVSRQKKTEFGTRYEIDGRLQTPDGRRPRLRTVWQADKGETAPRLITAYPLEEVS